MTSIAKTADRISEMLSSPSQLLKLESLFENWIKADSLFLVRVTLSFFSDHCTRQQRQHLGVSLQYLIPMSWEGMSPCSQKLCFELVVFGVFQRRGWQVAACERFLDSLSRAEPSSIRENKIGASINLDDQESKEFQYFQSILPEFDEQRHAPIWETGYVHSIGKMLVSVLRQQSKTGSCRLLGFLFSCLGKLRSEDWGFGIEIFVRIYESMEDKLAGSFSWALQTMYNLHSHSKSGRVVRLKCLQILFYALRGLNSTDIGESADTSELEKPKSLEYFGRWMEVFMRYLGSNEHSASSLYVVKILDVVFKDHPYMLPSMLPRLLPHLTLYYIQTLKLFLFKEVFIDISTDLLSNNRPGRSAKSKTTSSEWSLDLLNEDLHFQTLEQALLIKILDGMQSLIFTHPENVRAYFEEGAAFWLVSMFQAAVMTASDEVRWREDPSQYLLEEEDETNVYSMKQAAVSGIYSLIEKFGDRATLLFLRVCDFFAGDGLSKIDPGQSQTNRDKRQRSSKSGARFRADPDFPLQKQILKFCNSLGKQHAQAYQPIIVMVSSSQIPRFVSKKTETALFLFVSFLNDLLLLEPFPSESVSQMKALCLAIMARRPSEILLGRAIWAMALLATLKRPESDNGMPGGGIHMEYGIEPEGNSRDLANGQNETSPKGPTSTDIVDAKFLDTYRLVSSFMSPSLPLGVRLCSSRTLTRISFSIASENKQKYMAQNLGSVFPQIHAWTLDLLQLADPRAVHLMLDNLMSYYDICPELLENSLSRPICEALLTIYDQNFENAILANCFNQVFRKFAMKKGSRNSFWSLLVRYFEMRLRRLMETGSKGDLDYEKLVDSVVAVFDLVVHFCKS